jgi:multimeric flavodoxin WrbA
MQALILDGSFAGDDVITASREAIEGELRTGGWNVNSFTLRDTDIAACKGCFKCWIQTPGVCNVDDAGRRVAEQFIKSDLVVFLSPVTFGGYSSVLKKGLDRMIPNALPFFEKIQGEVHHKRRYDAYPRLVVLGVLSQPDEESERIFLSLAARNAINFYSPGFAAGVIFHTHDAAARQQEITTLLRKAGVAV